ncbi:MAG: nucleotidyltransferase domain-containing protein [Candidatus Wallbacteria bacterium]|nr:nucleotidyltransferase domain-containing protein [Candidatus Wallbacteria bacterium]
MGLGRDEIFAALQGRDEELRQLGVRSLSLFGSAVRSEATAESDLDFLVELASVSFDAYMDVKEHLERLFRRRVDLVLADAIKPRLRSRILAEAVRVPGL